MALKLKVKKTLFKRKVEGVTTDGYIGRVITNGTRTHAELAETASANTTIHKAEMKMAVEVFLDSVAAALKQGLIADLGPLGKLYPAVSGEWKQDPDELALAEMEPHVNYRPSDDIKAAIAGASLAWAKDDDDEEDTTDSGNQGGSGDSEEIG